MGSGHSFWVRTGREKERAMLKKSLVLLIPVVFVLIVSQGFAAVQYAVISESFNVPSGGTLTMEVVAADIRIVESQGGVNVSVKGLPDKYRQWLEMDQSSDGVMISFEPEERVRNIDSLLFEIGVPSEYSLDLSTTGGDIDVTRQITGIVDLSSAGGDISCREMVNGTVHVSTSGGDIEVVDVQGDIELSTSGGDIEAGIVSGSAEIETSGGDIEVNSVRGSLEASTAGGDIDVVEVGGNAALETAGGDITAGTIGGNLEASTAGGDIEVKEVRGEAKAETAGGDIKLEKIGGEFEASTVGGDVLVSLTGSYPGEMSTLGGELVLLLPSSAQVSIEAEVRFSGDDDDADSVIVSEFGDISLRRGSIINTVSSDFDINGGGPVIEMGNLRGTIAVKKLP